MSLWMCILSWDNKHSFDKTMGDNTFAHIPDKRLHNYPQFTCILVLRLRIYNMPAFTTFAHTQNSIFK
jgi:hypothetical protein